MVWGLSLACFVVNDRIKLLAYRFFDPAKSSPLSRNPLNPAPQIAARAYALYEQEGHHDGHATQDWLQAEQEILHDKSPK
jgi:hypothetical protein